MNPLSAFWLRKRQEKARALISGTRILDIGSRSERIAHGAIALDISRQVKPDVCASAAQLPFRSNTFDCVVMLEVIEHLDDRQTDAALRECKRVAPTLVLSTPNCDSQIWSSLVWPLWSHTVGREWIGAHKQFFGKSSIVSVLEKYGMTVLAKNFSHWNLLLSARTNDPKNKV